MDALLRRRLGSKPGMFLGLVLLAALSSSVPAAPGRADPEARPVSGHIEDHVVMDGCASPVRLCTAGTVSGGLRGTLELTITSLAPAGSPGVQLFTGTSTIATDRGTLPCSDSGAFNTSPASDGEGVHLCEITGGTGDLTGASGYLQETFRFQGTQASGDYRGELRLP